MSKTAARDPYVLEFDFGTIKHLGIQMYSTLPPVIGELVANAWDADAKRVAITIPTGMLSDASEIVVDDDGSGMTDGQVRQAYLVIGRDRRREENNQPTPLGRRVMGRKGIGKFSAFGVALEIEIETVREGETSRFKMDYDAIERAAQDKKLQMPSLHPTGTLKKGTRVTLRRIRKFRNRSIDIEGLRRGLARRFSILDQGAFSVIVNGDAITHKERDLKRLLEVGEEGKKYIWEFKNEEVQSGSGWKVSGWVGALDRTAPIEDGIQRGITLMARGKLVQEPWVFDAVVGQQFALSYLVGELQADFVDDAEDTIATARNSLVWDTEANAALKKWGEEQVKKIAREWAERRSQDNERKLEKNELYVKFREESQRFDSAKRKVADKLVRTSLARNPLATPEEQAPLIQMCLDFMEFDAFKELADQLGEVDVSDIPKLTSLFRDWEIVEAKEMMKVTEGRIATIEKLKKFIEENAREVPTIHTFFKEFPWILDPRWNLVDDEVKYSDLLRKEFPDDDLPEEERRIDFLCVRESNQIVVVEIKRPKARASKKELEQIENYVIWLREHVKLGTDKELVGDNVVGYLLCGDIADTRHNRGKVEILAKGGIYVRRYEDLLQMVRNNHSEFLERYDALRKSSKKKAAQAGDKK